MEFKQLVVERYACRNYSSTKIEDEKMGQLMKIVEMTPSAFNIQPWKIKVITDSNLKERLGSLALGGWAQISCCSHLLVLCANTEWDSTINKNIEGMRKAHVLEEGIKHYMAALNGLFGLLSPEQRLVESQKNVYLMAATIAYGAKSLGIDSCVIQGFDSPGFSKVLGLQSNLVPTLLITLGYAADKSTPKSRLPIEEIFF